MEPNDNFTILIFRLQVYNVQLFFKVLYKLIKNYNKDELIN